MQRTSRRSNAVLLPAVVAFAGLVVLPGCGSPQSELGGDDQDGIVGGDKTFEVRVDDDVFLPLAIWKTQNLAHVTLNLENTGTKAHGFRVHCLGAQCFPTAATIPPIDPGATATAKFQAPYAEGSYDVDDGTADGPKGQF
ncbi:MAG TPA: hypothetical protein VF395_14230, partial [Polyangiaceae bacterium]